MINNNHSLSPVMIKAMDNAREGITISDAALPDNPIIYANAGFLTISGYSREEVINKNCRYLQGELTNLETVRTLKKAIANNQPFSTDVLNYRKDGFAFWNHVSITPIFDDNGNITNWLGIHEDITAVRETGLTQMNVLLQKTISKTITESETNERNRIGTELHDNINQMLVAVNLYISLAKSNAMFLDTAQDLVKDTIEEIRKLSYPMVTAKSQQGDLVTVIKEMTEKNKPMYASAY